MKSIHRVITVVGMLALLLCLLSAAAFAQETGPFPEGVIEVPRGTHIDINDRSDVVSIVNCPVDIVPGDTFVVYLQDLPIGYVANSVSVNDGVTVVSVSSADKSLYGHLDESGEVRITPDMYEFVPASHVSYEIVPTSRYVSRGDGLSYQDGKLRMTVSLGDSSTTASLSNLKLSHSVSSGNIALTLSGSWDIESTLMSTENILSDVPLGEIRIAGIGKISVSISLEQELSLKANLGGSFSVGLDTTQDGAGSANKGFSCTRKTVEGKGSITASLKVTAGVDVLVAAADAYVDIGVTTAVQTKSTYNESTKHTTYCEDFRIYAYATVGVEAKYYSILSGGMKPLASKDFVDINEGNTPAIAVLHYEDGRLVSGCTQGMIIPDRHFGGFNSDFTGTILTEDRDGIVETDVSVPFDMTYEKSLTLANGSLNLNGHTLVVNGDFIHAGGTLTIGSGTLIVHGNYRMQSLSGGSYGDSNGTLNMTNSAGMVTVDGNFIVQTNSTRNSLTGGTFNLKGSFSQKNAAENAANFNSGTGLNLVMTGTSSHTISFDTMTGNGIGKLTLEGDCTVQSGFTTNIVNMQARKLTVNGDMMSRGDVDINGGTLTVKGSLTQPGGTMFIDGGKLNVSGNYYIIGSDSVFEAGKVNITSSSGYLKMMYAVDEVRVGGSFMTKAYYGHGSDKLAAGTMYVGGNFTQLRTSYDNFAPKADHRTVLNGTGEQTVSFETEGCGFGTLEATNEEIKFEKNVSWLNQSSDIHATSNGAALSSRSMNLNGQQLTIDGDIGIISDIDVKNGAMIVNGSVRQANGTMFIDGGKLDVSGDYYIIGSDSVFEAGKENITASNGILKMMYAVDEVRVGGSFMTKAYYGHGSDMLAAGTMYVGGNFTQLRTSYDNFAPKVDHRTVLNGTGEQTVSFETENCGFGTLEATNEEITFEKNVSWLNQSSDIHATSNGATLSNRNMNLNGKTLTIDGDIGIISGIDVKNGAMIVNGSVRQANGTMFIDGGKLDVSGDYYIIGSDSVFEAGKENITTSHAFLKMMYAADEVRVGGSFMTKAYYGHGSDMLAAGTMYVGGNFTQLRTSYDNFAPKVDHRTVLNGTGKQTVSFETEKCGFGTLEATNDQITFEKNVSWLKQSSDVHATSNGATLSNRSIDLNGQQLTIDGDIWMVSSIDVKNGSMTVNGSLKQGNGTMFIDGGKLNVSGNYYIIGSDSVFEAGMENITTSHGFLRMTYAMDEVRVGGSFMTKAYYDHGSDMLAAGTMYVGGNFTQLRTSYNNFAPKVDHRTVLNGTGEQTVSFETQKCRFGTLELTQPMSMYVFNPNPCWLKLLQNEAYVFGTPDFTLPAALTEIEEYAFEGIRAKVVAVPESCVSIGAYAFKDSTVTQIRVPAGCTIGTDAFAGCESVAMFGAAGSPAEAYCATHSNCTFVAE